jgi:radical SAM superfamily enzyme YgiQ (UPF0313 family)
MISATHVMKYMLLCLALWLSPGTSLRSIHTLSQGSYNANPMPDKVSRGTQRGTLTVLHAANILTMPYPEIIERIGGSGKARLFWDSIKAGVHPLHQPEGVGLSEKARRTVREILDGDELVPAEVTSQTTAQCGTVKMLMRLQDGQSIETVLIPSNKYDRTTICVSTQVGCDRGCAFCLTGKMGFIRNLTSSEIVGQVKQRMSA